jgi:Protein of unknown function (DUF3592)
MAKLGFGCVTIFLSFFYLAGFWMLGYSLWDSWRSLRAASWPTTSGTIEEAKIHAEFNNESMSHSLKVRYKYVVGGIEHEGTRLAFGYDGNCGLETHQQILDKLRAAKSIDVRYDPDDPANSCLSFGLHRSLKEMLAFAIAWLLFASWFHYAIWNMTFPDTVLIKNLSVR